MTESNPVQVTLSDDGIRINAVTEQAKSTDQDVKSLYDPNMMSVIEKQGSTARFAGETSRYNVILARAKDAGIDTKDLESAYSTLNIFMATVIGTGDKASDIDRDKYAEALANFNNRMAIMQDALQSSFDKDIENAKSSVAVASQVASTAVIVASQAAVKGDNASKSASSALQAGKDASDAYDKLKISNRNLALLTGVPFTVAGQNATNQWSNVYRLSEKLTPGTLFTASFDIVSTTGVGTFTVQSGGGDPGADWQEIQPAKQLTTTTQHITATMATTATLQSINLRLDGATGTITLSHFILSESSKEVMYTPAETVIDNAVIGNAQIKDASINTAKISELSANKLTAGTIDGNVINVKNLNASNITAGKIGASHLDVGTLSALTANLGTMTAGTIKGVDIVAKTFSTANSTFTVDQNGQVTATSLSLIGNKNFVYNSELMANGAGWVMDQGYVSEYSAHNGTPGLTVNAQLTSSQWIVFGKSKQMPITISNTNGYSASVWFLDWGSQAGAIYIFTLAFYNASGTRIGFKEAFHTGDGKSHDWELMTIENLVPPTGTTTVDVAYRLHAGNGHGAFSQPMLTQSEKYQGYSPDTGNVLSAGQVILDNNGTLTTTYDGINQDSDNTYHAWKLNTGTLKIGGGYITADSSGTRTINGAAQSISSVKGTLTASYLKFTSATGGRAYMDADLISLSTSKMNDIVVINSNGVHIADQGITVVGGVNASGSWGQFGGIRIGNGANTHTINSPSNDWIYFEQGIGSGNAMETIVAANLSASSQLSKKKTVTTINPSGNVVANTNLATYLYKGETNTHGLHMGPIIDDVSEKRSYYIAPEIMALDGETIDINRATFYGWSAIQALQRENEQLQIRLRKLEIEEVANG